MSSPSSAGAGPASAPSPGAGPAREPRQHPLRMAFGVVLFVGWGLLTYAWVASTVYLVGHGWRQPGPVLAWRLLPWRRSV